MLKTLLIFVFGMYVLGLIARAFGATKGYIGWPLYIYTVAATTLGLLMAGLMVLLVIVFYVFRL